MELSLAALAFVGTHLGIAGTRLRQWLVRRIGERAYLIAYAVISLVTIWWLVEAYKVAPYVETWGQLYALQPVALGLMFLSFLLVVGGLTTFGPTLIGAESTLDRGEPARGMLRITRHPCLMGLTLWSITHLVVNGDMAGLILFGSFTILTVVGALSIDQKRAAKLGEKWADFARKTSVVPFAAILAGRNRLSLGEIGWWRIPLGIVIFFLFLMFHRRLFGVSPVEAMR